MTDPLIDKARELREALLNEQEVMEYLKNKKLYEESEELQQMKKEIVRAGNEGRTKDHQALLNAFHSHPLVVNYEASKESVKALLTELKNILE